MILESSIEKKSHNGIEYFMVNEELALRAMKEIAELAFDAGREIKYEDVSYDGGDTYENIPIQIEKEQFIKQLFGEEEK
jgi:hypothetical protein